MWHVTTDPTPKRTRRRWLFVATAAWAVLLAGLAVYAVRRGEPTVRAETSVAEALPTAGQAGITADTGCRPLTRPVTEARPQSDSANRAPVQAVLDALKVTDASFQTHRVSCDRGGSVWTVQADGAPGSAPASLVDVLHE